MSTSKPDRDKLIKEAQKYLLFVKAETKGDQEKKDYILKNKEQISTLADSFLNQSNFTYARRLLQTLYEYTSVEDIFIKKLAVSTYKDTDLSSDIKYDIAAVLLNSRFKINGKISDANALGILGSIFKKKWKYENHDGHLYQALRYYLAGYNLAQNEKSKSLTNLGYCGINLAFVYDLLANLGSFQQKDETEYLVNLEKDPFKKITENYSGEALKYRKEIHQIYTDRYAELTNLWKSDREAEKDFDKKDRYWFFVTWAEAALGLGDFSGAANKFAEAVKLSNIPSWKKYTASVQGYHLVELLFDKDSDKKKLANNAIKILLNVDSIPENHRDKIGLALSGGGFRASLFHIGVLAKLAEADLLRKVEVISCVSGGSILGAFYYLNLKELLESKKYKTLAKLDYIRLVEKIEKEFLDQINKNIRLHVLSDLRANMKMAFQSSYNRTSRTAELYDKFLYNKTPGSNQEIYMKDLFICPGGDTDFRPIRDNWQIENKVPILILNATTLNTGHSWQFTASWMGESPSYINSEFDVLPNLRRMYYKEAPNGYGEIPLSKAVAASAGVPGLFAPLEFEDLYEGYSKVLLVDGGVHDNQGISTLYEQECNMLIVSDASGQLVADQQPSSNVFGVFARTNSILQERVRFSQFRDLEARKKSGVIRDYILMHFTKDLPRKIVNWKDCIDPYVAPILKKGKKKNADETDYKIKIKIQQLLARIRTDLDAFHETEAYALMYSGYKMTAHEIKKASSVFFRESESNSSSEVYPKQDNFMDLHKVHENTGLRKKLEKKLEPSADMLGKAFRLSKWGVWFLKIKWVIVAILIVGILAVFLPVVFLLKVLKIAGVILLVVLVERLLSKLCKIKSLALSLLGLFILLLLWILSLSIRRISTKWYLMEGKLPGKQS